VGEERMDVSGVECDVLRGQFFGTHHCASPV